MPQVIVALEEQELSAALQRAADHMMTFDQFVRKALAEAVLAGDDADDGTATMSTSSLQELVRLSIDNARNYTPNSEFLLVDVCPRASWEACSSGDRKKLGKMFRKQVEQSGVAKWDRYRSDHHSIYRRT